MELPKGDYGSGGEVVGAVSERVRELREDGGRRGEGVGVMEGEEERCVVERKQAVRSRRDEVTQLEQAKYLDRSEVSS